MLRIAIVEDMPEEREKLEQFSERYCQENGLEADIRLFGDGSAFLENCPENLDLVMLDIEMPRLGGMDTARKLRSFDRKVQILFVTCLVQYAIDGYSVDAADFIAKPVAYPVFCSSMDRVMEKIVFYTPRFLMTSYAREPLSCQIQQIGYIESLNKRTIIHMTDGGTHYSSEPLYALEEKLADEPFFRCHNAFLVNLAHVRSVGTGSLTVCGEEIPVSKYRKRDFMQKLAACRGRIL